MSENGLNPGRRNFLLGATAVVGAGGVAGLAVPFVGSWNPSAKALAAGAPIKVDVSRLGAGEILGPIPAWRDKPIFVIKRSQEMIDLLNVARPPSRPRFGSPATANLCPKRNPVAKPEVAVLVGLCTHLSVRPSIARQLSRKHSIQNGRGFYCPCHGSKFDLAGRVYAGVPAPSNLEVPPHYFETDDVIVIGEDGGLA